MGGGGGKDGGGSSSSGSKSEALSTIAGPEPFLAT